MSIVGWVVVILIALLFGTDGFESEPAATVDDPTPAVVEIEPAPGWEPVTIGPIEGVIIPEDAEESFLSGHDTFWTPKVADVEAAEAAIAADQGELAHHRQYAGVIDDNGNRLVLINGFCDTFANWMAEPVIVMDGGDCYFEGTYNVETDELESFRFNGEA